MDSEPHYSHLIDETVRLALAEDIGQGDITSLLTVPEEREAEGVIKAKEEFVLAGMPFVKRVFHAVDPGIRITVLREEGERVNRETEVARISGSARSLLAGERVALNMLQRISGIATLTRSFVEQVAGLRVRIVDTRKTTPGMRLMEKYGVRIGGGANHRFGLFDGILIKDNHIAIAGGVKEALERAKKAHHLMKIEIEVKDFDELNAALEGGAEIIMLDNMSAADMKKAAALVRGRALLEASGGITIDNLREVAGTGVDIISIGALTHSARAVDISMKISS